MDISVDRPLEYKEIQVFFEQLVCSVDFFLIYEGLSDWDDIQNESLIVQYLIDDEVEQGFRYGLSVWSKTEKEPLLMIESLAKHLADYFNCATVCDASRVILQKFNVFYCLLFENNEVFLVDDCFYEETGGVRKIIKLGYQVPEYPL